MVIENKTSILCEGIEFRIDFKYNYRTLSYNDNGTWRPILDFRNANKELASFSKSCKKLQNTPNVFLCKNKYVTIATNIGRYTLLNNTLSLVNKKTKIFEKNITPNNEKYILERYFKIII
jgi:hypothetical protein